MNIIKHWLDKQKQKSVRQRATDLYNEFKVIEKDGTLWLTHLGVAFKEIPSTTSAEGVAQLLNEARETAVKHDSAAPSKPCVRPWKEQNY